MQEAYSEKAFCDDATNIQFKETKLQVSLFVQSQFRRNFYSLPQCLTRKRKLGMCFSPKKNRCNNTSLVCVLATVTLIRPAAAVYQNSIFPIVHVLFFSADKKQGSSSGQGRMGCNYFKTLYTHTHTVFRILVRLIDQLRVRRTLPPPE